MNSFRIRMALAVLLLILCVHGVFGSNSENAPSQGSTYYSVQVTSQGLQTPSYQQLSPAYHSPYTRYNNYTAPSQYATYSTSQSYQSPGYQQPLGYQPSQSQISMPIETRELTIQGKVIKSQMVGPSSNDNFITIKVLTVKPESLITYDYSPGSTIMVRADQFGTLHDCVVGRCYEFRGVWMNSELWLSFNRGDYVNGIDCPGNADTPSSEKCIPKPILGHQLVSPTYGQAGTTLFTFKVVYIDQSENEPIDAGIRIYGYDGTNKVFDNGYNTLMEKVSGDITQGAIYSYSTTLPAKGDYRYYFFFSNKKGCKTYLPSQGFTDSQGLPGPQVSSPTSEGTADTFNNCVALHNQGKYEEALKCYKKVTESDPRNSAALLGKCMCTDNVGRHEEAIQCYKEVTEMDPTNAGAWYDMGCALSNLGRKEEALQCYDRGIEVAKDSKSAGGVWYAKGIVLEGLGRHEEADVAFNKAKELGFNS